MLFGSSKHRSDGILQDSGRLLDVDGIQFKRRSLIFVRTVFPNVRTVFARLTMEHSGRSITNVGGQTERPAWVDAFLVELKESTHSLCMELQCRLTGLETKLALTDRALTEELNIMRMELFSVRQQLSELSQSVHTVPIQLQTLVRRVDNMEEHLAHVRDALGQDLDEPARDLD
ncbi:hypothetical protein CJ030_MR7G018911 [Morella rubra]|uniref:Uncharacterized protein n=1 Tax=Morella rubra TaxID=262757 RepID=A0A6A1V2X0_9ROSI|nr:hypothetical protein CJ030_MR7G018911 [Morella rubra]